MGHRRRIVLKNLRIAFAGEKNLPELRELARQSFRRSVANLVSAVHTAHMDYEDLRACVELENPELAESTVQRGNGMLLLPPIVGFAIFFCLSHSPKHFAAARAEVKGGDTEALLFTCAAICIAALVFALRSGMVAENRSIEDGAIFASFVTLSILTVPHMVVPRIANR
jgi:hypothetical protein